MAKLVAGFDDFVISRGPALVHLAYRLAGNHAFAEDLVQEALLKAHRRWRRVTEAEAPDPYVRRILLNEYLSWRRRRSSTEIVAPVPDRLAPGDSDSVVQRDLVWGMLAKLPRRHEPFWFSATTRISPTGRSRRCSGAQRER